MLKALSPSVALAATLLMSPFAALAQSITIPDDPASLDPEIIVEGERRLEPEEIIRGADQLIRRTGLFQPVSRFTEPVCVEVIGLGPARDRKIAKLIRSNVAAVGLPLAKEKCRPNAITIITDQPQAMYSAIQQKRPALVGVGVAWNGVGIADLREYSKGQLESLIRSGAPAVSWSTYATDVQNSANIQNFNAGGAFWGLNANPAFARGGRSRGSSVVLFDWKQINGVHIHQLADFATLHLLGSPRMFSETEAAKVPTILTLFEQGPKRAPQRLTTFDRAYLCGIYRLREGSLNTRIAQNMLDVYDSDCVRVGAPAEVVAAVSAE